MKSLAGNPRTIVGDTVTGARVTGARVTGALVVGASMGAAVTGARPAGALVTGLWTGAAVVGALTGADVVGLDTSSTVNWTLFAITVYGNCAVLRARMALYVPMLKGHV